MLFKIILGSLKPAEVFNFRSLKEIKNFLDKTKNAPDTVMVYDEDGDNVARFRKQRNGKYTKA